jgi:hypothetical protein
MPGRFFQNAFACLPAKTGGASLLLGHVFRCNMLPRHGLPPPILAGADKQSHLENTPLVTIERNENDPFPLRINLP